MNNDNKALAAVVRVLEDATEGLHLHQIVQQSSMPEDAVKRCLRELAGTFQIELIPTRGRWGNRYASTASMKPVMAAPPPEDVQRPAVEEETPAIDEYNGVISDGSTASYYELPEGATELQHLIGHRDMNAQIGEIFRACYRFGKVSHSPKVRDIKKIIFYAQAELDRLTKLG